MYAALALGLLIAGEPLIVARTPPPFQLVKPKIGFAPFMFKGGSTLAESPLMRDANSRPRSSGDGWAAEAMNVCGMIVLKADPNLDPKISRAAPKDLDPKIERPSGCAK